MRGPADAAREGTTDGGGGGGVIAAAVGEGEEGLALGAAAFAPEEEGAGEEGYECCAVLVGSNMCLDLDWGRDIPKRPITMPAIAPPLREFCGAGVTLRPSSPESSFAGRSGGVWGSSDCVLPVTGTVGEAPFPVEDPGDTPKAEVCVAAGPVREVTRVTMLDVLLVDKVKIG